MTPEQVNAEGQEKNESPGSRSETLARNADAGEKSQGENSDAPVPSAPAPQPADGRASMQAELGAALGSALSHYKSGDMQACAASLVRIVDLFRDAAKEPRK